MNLEKLGIRGANFKKTAKLERSVYFDVAHLHSEVTECFEALRDAEKLSAKHKEPLDDHLRHVWFDGDHPEGFSIELADVVIIAAYLAHRTGVDLEKAIEIKMAYNEDKGIKKALRG